MTVAELIAALQTHTHHTVGARVLVSLPNGDWYDVTDATKTDWDGDTVYIDTTPFEGINRKE